MKSPLSPEAVAQMVADLRAADKPLIQSGPFIQTRERLRTAADMLTTLAAENATLRAERDELAAAIDSIETSNGLTSNGNLWRFWVEKAREQAKANTALRASEAAAWAKMSNMREWAACICDQIVKDTLMTWPQKAAIHSAASRIRATPISLTLTTDKEPKT